MTWIPVSDPPILYRDGLGCFTSKPVLVYARGIRGAGKVLTATLEKWEDDIEPPEWYSNCSERWNLYDTVKFWMPLPNPPKDQP